MDVENIIKELKKCPQKANVYVEMIRNDNAQIVGVQNLKLQDTDPLSDCPICPVVVLNCAYFYGMVKDSGYLDNEPENLSNLIEKIDKLLEIISRYRKDPNYNDNENANYALSNMAQSLENVKTYFSYLPFNLRAL